MSAANWRSRLANMLREKTKFGDDDAGEKYVMLKLMLRCFASFCSRSVARLLLKINNQKCITLHQNIDHKRKTYKKQGQS